MTVEGDGTRLTHSEGEGQRRHNNDEEKFGISFNLLDEEKIENVSDVIRRSNKRKSSFGNNPKKEEEKKDSREFFIFTFSEISINREREKSKIC